MFSVKQVLSGDTIVIRDVSKNTTIDRIIGFSNVACPKMGSKGAPDEPFAFECREFLRRLLVGKRVLLPEGQKKEHDAPKTGKEYVETVLLERDNEKINVIELCLKSGWVKPKDNRNEAWNALSKEAMTSSLGIFNPIVPPGRVLENVDEHDFVAKNKGKCYPAIIEQVRGASSFRALLPSNLMLNFQLSGIRTPMMRSNHADKPDLVEPFAEEAKFFTELRLLQREVKVIIDGIHNNTVYATIQHPAGNITELLLQQGLASISDWTISLPENKEILIKLEQEAKAKKIRIWKDFKQAETRTFEAKVTRIFNAETIFVKHGNEEMRITFSSIRQPKMTRPTTAEGKTDSNAEIGYNFEAREHLRHRLIGKNVSVTVEYKKPPMENFPEKTCATVYINGKNIAEELLEMGLAILINHKKEDLERSGEYQKLIMAQEAALQKKIGLFSNKEPPLVRFSEASENAAKAKSFLNLFKRHEKVTGVVEYIVSPGRLRIYIPKEQCRLSFIFSGVQTAREKNEPFANEAMEFVTSRLLQHDVEITFESIDKNGGFVGVLFTKRKENFNIILLEEGFGRVHGYSADQSEFVNQYYSAEKRAIANNRRVWSIEKQPEEEKVVQTFKLVNLIVTHISLESIFVHFAEENHPLDSFMKDFSAYFNKGEHDFPLNAQVGTLVAAKFTQDDQWYRAQVKKVYPDMQHVDVVYVDYGNQDVKLPMKRIKSLPEKFKSLPFQAHECKLSYVHFKPDYIHDAVNRLNELLFTGDVLRASIDSKEKTISFVSLTDAKGRNVNALLVAEGLAYVPLKRGDIPEKVYAILSEQQRIAKQARVLWSHSVEYLGIWRLFRGIKISFYDLL